MLNLYFVFVLFSLSYVVGCVLLVNNVASAIKSAHAVPPGIVVKMEFSEPAHMEFRNLEQGAPVLDATLQTPTLAKRAAHSGR